MKITENVFALDVTYGAYAYLVLGEEIILIDTGLPWVGRRLVKELASMNVPVQDIKHVLLTHHDIDHIGNAVMLQKLSGAQLWSSQEDIPYILGQIPRPGFKKYLARVFGVPKPEKLSVYNPKQCIGGVKVIPSPGHTPGHVCLLFEDVLFAGDLVKNKKGRLTPYPSGWNWNTSILMDSIQKVSDYSFRWICPAHGKPIQRDNWPL